MTESIFDHFPGESGIHLGTLLAPKITKNLKTHKKQCPESGAEKTVLPELTRIGPMCDPYSKYHMFGEVKECQFGWLWGSFWLPFGVTLGIFLRQNVIRGLKKGFKKQVRKLMENGLLENPGNRV